MHRSVYNEYSELAVSCYPIIANITATPLNVNWTDAPEFHSNISVPNTTFESLSVSVITGVGLMIAYSEEVSFPNNGVGKRGRSAFVDLTGQSLQFYTPGNFSNCAMNSSLLMALSQSSWGGVVASIHVGRYDWEVLKRDVELSGDLSEPVLFASGVPICYSLPLLNCCDFSPSLSSCPDHLDLPLHRIFEVSRSSTVASPRSSLPFSCSS